MMTCSDVTGLLPAYLAGDLDAPRAAAFGAHLERCAACAAEIEQQRELDSGLRAVVFGDVPETAALERRIHVRIAASSRRAWAGAIAAGIAGLVLLAGLGFHAWTQPPRFYADAAQDHRREVVEGQRRMWYTDRGVEALARREGLAASAVSMVPAGFRFERAKICRLNGIPFLHLVYSDGGERCSLYLRPRSGGEIRATTADFGAEHVAGFETGQVTAFCVGSKELAAALARSAAAYL